MNLETLKNEFDQALAMISDTELVRAFSDMGCDIEIKTPRLSQWEEYESSPVYSTRHSMSVHMCPEISPSDLNELALAA